MQLLLQPRVSLPARHKILAQMQINVNGCRVSLFYNAIGAVAQCPYNWGVGSAFHLMKIHILFSSALDMARTFIKLTKVHSL